MASKTEIANLAISHLATGKTISDFETENSEEARACRTYYETAKRMTLTDHDWVFATRFETLGLIESDPMDEWDYSYRYPSQCVKIRRILSGERSDTLDTQIPFKIISDSTGKLIYTDQEDAQVEITRDLDDPELFSAHFTMALSFRLAMYIAPRITSGDPFKMRNEIRQLYLLEISNAIAENLNSEKQDKRPKSEFIKARS